MYFSVSATTVSLLDLLAFSLRFLHFIRFSLMWCLEYFMLLSILMFLLLLLFPVQLGFLTSQPFV